MLQLTKEMCEEVFTYDPLIGLSRRKNGKKITGRQTLLRDRYYETKEIAWVMAYGSPPIGDLVVTNRDLNDLRLCNLAELPTLCGEVTQGWLQEYLTLVDGEAFVKKQYSRKFFIGDKVGYTTPSGYTLVEVSGQRLMLHKLVWLYTYGELPPGFIDHINGVKSDNRIENLRLATKSQNGFNTGLSKVNKSGFKGVSWSEPRQKWLAYAQLEGTTRNLGGYSTPEEASAAYQAFAKASHGEFYRPPEVL